MFQNYIYRTVVSPFLFQFDPEDIHHKTAALAQWTQLATPVRAIIKSLFDTDFRSLYSTVSGITFPNPIGLAAGFDKNATLISFMHDLGFGFSEVGSITFEPSAGNPKPRLFRLKEDQALINRMGLNNEGAERIARRIRRYSFQKPVGINIAKTHNPSIIGDKAIRDYIQSYTLISELGDYHCLNISCPNTTEGKTFEDASALSELLSEINRIRNNAIPIFVKFSVDLADHEIDTLVERCESFDISGYVAVNTSNSREGLSTHKDILSSIGHGGLSGTPIEAASNRIIKRVYKNVGENKPIIGLGGISDMKSALRKFSSGASLLQLYTGLIYQGPGLISALANELNHLIFKHSFSGLSEFRHALITDPKLVETLI